jgi:hypothetical protein
MYSGKIAVPPGGGGIVLSYNMYILLLFLSNAKIRLVLREFFGAI